jgi:hypothetical protein
MPSQQTFSYIAGDSAWGEASLMPYVPLTIYRDGQAVNEYALVDSGSSVNVMPYSLGERMGLNWEDELTLVKLTGNLASLEAKGIVVNARDGDSEIVELVFAWTRTDDAPFLLGQINVTAQPLTTKNAKKAQRSQRRAKSQQSLRTL